MSGSSGGGFGGMSSDQIRSWIDQAQDEAMAVEQETSINRVLGDLLAQYNERDVGLVRERLNEIQEGIEDTLETTVDLRFGGSVAKRTYVDGLSDVDALAILRDPQMQSLRAGEVLDRFADTLRRELGYEVRVSEGQLAVTVLFPDGMTIQILPAIRTNDGVRIPASAGEGWSSVIRPEAFAAKLTDSNQANGARLIPVIKLAKAALANLPQEVKISGYHVESLALEAFHHYDGPKTYKAMLHHFFRESSELVRSPIRDGTGQSLLVDNNLGDQDSRPRQYLSGVLDRIARRMSNADRSGSPENWLQAIDESF